MAKDYAGSTYRVDRVKAERGPYEYEFNLTIDGERVLTASQLERAGVSFDDVPNWTQALYAFAEAYIDHDGDMQTAVEAVKRRFN